MSRSAKVTSVDAIREFRLVLRRYQEMLQDICETLGLETHRAQDWIENDRARYWPHAWRQAEHQLVSAQSDLQLAKMAAMQNEHKSCIDEKKAVERALARQRLCEEKMRRVKHWRIKLRHENEEFRGKLAKLKHYHDVDLPRALGALDRVIRALEKYTDMTRGTPLPSRIVLDPTSTNDQNENSTVAASVRDAKRQDDDVGTNQPASDIEDAPEHQEPS